MASTGRTSPGRLGGLLGSSGGGDDDDSPRVGISLLADDPDNRATLVLSDGYRVTGTSFGAKTAVSGECCFSTSMVGYPEALTDPSFRGQILVLTYPLVGNYGVPSEDIKDEFGLPKFFESSDIHITGLVVSEYSARYSHWAAKQALGDWLREHNVPAISGVDTRHITKLLRDKGSMLAKLFFDPAEEVGLEFDDPNKRNLVAEVSTKEVRVFNEGASPRVVAVDCGMKYNIIRYLARQGVELTVVPYDYDFSSTADTWDGVFVSNGPGDPQMAAAAIESLRRVMTKTGRPIPVFGICLGNQIMALAAGAKTFKMRYGNRGMNQPAIDMRTGRCYITAQNHGFAVDADTLPEQWRTLFMNANDHTNEGIVHVSKPYFSVQFHPEARGGPTDSDFLFQHFMEQVRGNPALITTISPRIYISRAKLRRRVLLLGSGGLSIGQAGEFDYSGSQALKALKEAGIESILVNPNIATVQTSKGLADRVYFLPVTKEFVLQVLEKERPDGILISMGGQTALNVGIQLHDEGHLERLGVDVLGTPVSTIVATEDREVFAQKLAEIDETVARSLPATTVEEAVVAAAKIGYPVLVRAAFALGGLGSGFADDEAGLRELATLAFATSSQILIDQDLRGWKEVEYEVVRDVADNCITVCNMENFDPLGVHTGDSIVVAPSQTLTNSEYFMLRQTALKVVRHLGVVGECNIQYALNPESEKYCIIEVNARLSRSSALASKATGYPLAYVATKLSLGVDLVSIKNSVTKVTTACFEPSLDYCVVKMPRWDLRKFSRVSTQIGSSMKSVGEVMAIGRSFEEAIQKAVRMVDPTLKGFEPRHAKRAADAEEDAARTGGGAALRGAAAAAGAGAGSGSGGKGAASVGGRSDTTPPRPNTLVGSAGVRPPRAPTGDKVSLLSPGGYSPDEVDHNLSHPSDTRLLHIAEALQMGYTVDRVHELTRIDRWFLTKLARINEMGREVASFSSLRAMPAGAMRLLKQAGFSDRQIADRIGCEEAAVRRTRVTAGVVPVTKQIDTLAAEFPAQTNYLYMTYHGDENDVEPSGDGVMVLGSGPYCIGSSVEFDWCAVSCVRALRESGFKAIVVNYNPETVSTDFDESDRLYFEELSMERVMDIYDAEAAAGVIISVGGQIPNNLALPLHRMGANVLGTSPTDIDCAEDRNKFSRLLDRLGIDQPDWAEISDAARVREFVDRVGFPVLVRPSYVLSGAAMRVVSDEKQLRSCLDAAIDVSADHPVVVSKFILNAKEVEFDAVAKNGRILNYAISEHVENAGVHSGDATLVLPAQKLYVETIRRIKRISSLIARALKISGPFNIQFISRDNQVKVIECNLRASRTFPFISKTFDFNFIAQATRVFTGLPVKSHTVNLLDHDFVAVKAPMFSFSRLQGADPTLGVEMMSTGEVACFGQSVEEAFLKAILSAGFKMPTRTRNILISAATPMKDGILPACQGLEKLGYNLFATPGTHKFLADNGVVSTMVAKPSAPAEEGVVNVMSMFAEKLMDLAIVLPSVASGEAATEGYRMRRGAVDFGASLITNIKCAALLASALEREKGKDLSIRSMQEHYLIESVV